MVIYFCTACAVFGKGGTCWNCGALDLERDSERVQDFEKLEASTSSHHCTYGGGRQPLLTYHRIGG